MCSGYKFLHQDNCNKQDGSGGNSQTQHWCGEQLCDAESLINPMLVVSMKEDRCVIYVCVEKGASLLTSIINKLCILTIWVTCCALFSLSHCMIWNTLNTQHANVSIHVDLNTQQSPFTYRNTRGVFNLHFITHIHCKGIRKKTDKEREVGRWGKSPALADISLSSPPIC